MSPPRDPELFLARAQEASAARLRARRQAVTRDLTALADPRTVARQHPWLATAVAAGAGWFVVAHVMRRRPAPPAPPAPAAKAALPWTTRLLGALQTALVYSRYLSQALGPLPGRPVAARPGAELANSSAATATASNAELRGGQAQPDNDGQGIAAGGADRNDPMPGP